MSNATLTAALRRMGYGGHEMTGHGFRSMASTLLNEQGIEEVAKIANWDLKGGAPKTPGR